MTYTQLAYLHLATVVPAFFLGAIQLFKHKGTPGHRLIGRVYMLLIRSRCRLHRTAVPSG